MEVTGNARGKPATNGASILIQDLSDVNRPWLKERSTGKSGKRSMA
jgi:hypothetical protein